MDAGLVDEIAATAGQLPAAKQAELLEFAEFLLSRSRVLQTEADERQLEMHLATLQLAAWANRDAQFGEEDTAYTEDDLRWKITP